MSRLGKILYLLSGLSLISFVVARFLVGEFINFLWIPLGLVLVFFVAAIFVDRALYKEFLFLKTTKHGMNMGMLILLILVMLVTINYLSVRNYKTFDFSLAQVNTLSDQSIKLLKSLNADLKITFFYKKGAEGAEESRRAFQSLIKKYQDVSSLVKLDFVEVNQRPDLAEEYGVNKGSGVVFLDYKGKRNRIEKIDEQEITGALVKATRENDKTVYFIQGHGEGDLEETREPTGLAGFKNLLEGNRYQVKPLVLSGAGEIPKDADIVVLAGAKSAFLDFEIKAIEEYLKSGGNLLVALEPRTAHGLEKLIVKTGLVFDNNYVVSVMDTVFGKAINPTATPAGTFSASSPITQVLGKNEFVVFRLPQSLTKTVVPESMRVDEIVKTDNKAVGFPDTKFNTNGQSGPFTLAASVQGRWPGASAEAKEFMMVVVGDYDFMANQLLYQNLNRDLSLNMISALARDESMISITPKEIMATEMNMTESKFYMMIFALVIPLPIILLASSGFLWLRRRNA